MTMQPLAIPPQSQAGRAAAAAPSNSPDTVSENQFLELLVAQIRHQDPTNPTDSTTFITQLAQFSSLEQLIAIRGELGSHTAPSAAAARRPAAIQGGN